MTAETKQRLRDWALIAGLLTMLAMAVLPLLNINEEWTRWAYAAGAAVTLIARLTAMGQGVNLREKRLNWLGVVSAALFVISAAMIFYSTGTNDWIAFLLAGAVMQLYVSYMLPRAHAEGSDQSSHK